MAKKKEIPKIRIVTVKYNGDRAQFDRFMQTMITDYLEQGSMPKTVPDPLVQKVEIFEKSS